MPAGRERLLPQHRTDPYKRDNKRQGGGDRESPPRSVYSLGYQVVPDFPQPDFDQYGANDAIPTPHDSDELEDDVPPVSPGQVGFQLSSPIALGSPLSNNSSRISSPRPFVPSPSPAGQIQPPVSSSPGREWSCSIDLSPRIDNDEDMIVPDSQPGSPPFGRLFADSRVGDESQCPRAIPSAYPKRPFTRTQREVDLLPQTSRILEPNIAPRLEVIKTGEFCAEMRSSQRTMRNYLRAWRPILTHYALGSGRSYADIPCYEETSMPGWYRPSNLHTIQPNVLRWIDDIGMRQWREHFGLSGILAHEDIIRLGITLRGKQEEKYLLILLGAFGFEADSDEYERLLVAILQYACPTSQEPQ